MKRLASCAWVFFMIAAIGNAVEKDATGLVECIGLAFLSLWALEES